MIPFLKKLFSKSEELYTEEQLEEICKVTNEITKNILRKKLLKELDKIEWNQLTKKQLIAIINWVFR